MRASLIRLALILLRINSVILVVVLHCFGLPIGKDGERPVERGSSR